MSKEKIPRINPRRGADRRPVPEVGAFLRTRPVPLPFGAASAVLRNGKLHSVEWERSRGLLEASLSEKFPGAKVIDPAKCGAGRLLEAYSGKGPVSPESIASIEVEWDRVPGFAGEVLRETARIPYAGSATYGEIAARCGRPGAARAAGGALSRNPWPIIVPCHRVVGAGGKLTGFGKGIRAKRILLEFEERNAAAPGRCPRIGQIV